MQPIGVVRFVDFVERDVGVRLAPGQRVLVAVAFDGVEPGSFEGTDRELARRIFGDVDTIPPEARAVLVAVCGARGGKSMILVACYSLWRALTADLGGLGPGELASALIVAPDQRLARQSLRFALGAAQGSRSIVPLVSNVTADSFVIRRPDGAVTVECLPATRGGSAVRGRSLVSACLDEAAFFRDEAASVNDRDLFAATSPRVMLGGMVVVDSTPWAETGLLYELFSRNHGKPRTCIAAHAPTVLLRDDARVRAMVERERERDPANAEREYDAEFSSAGASTFFSRDAIEQSTDDDLNVTSVVVTGRPVVACGVDLGFRKDASAIVVVRVEDGIAVVAEVAELRPAKGEPLKPSAVCEAFARIARKHGAQRVNVDSFYIESAREHFGALGISVLEAPAGQSGKVATYEKTRDAMNEGRVRIAGAHKPLLAQLRAITGRPTSGGGLLISAPRGRTGHGDSASAFVLAVWSLAVAGHLRARRPLVRSDRTRVRSMAAEPWCGASSGGSDLDRLVEGEDGALHVRRGQPRRVGSLGGGF